MDKASFDHIRNLWPPDPGADPYWLLGKRVEIKTDGGEPRIEVPPQREMIPLEFGESILYVQCHDPACPANKPGTHHAHGTKS